MNETLKQIAIKAKVEHCISHVRLEEFAELIVRECASIAEQKQAYNDCHGIHLTIDQCILSEFGVEE